MVEANGNKMEKKMAAALAAVAEFMAQEQQAAIEAMMPKPEGPAVAQAGVWAISGRQTQMSNRQLMQLRAFR